MPSLCALFRQCLPVALLAVFCVATPVSAMPLGDYNLILSGDYHYQGGEVEGRTLLGGNLNAAGQSPVFGTRLPSPPDTDGLTVVGDVNAGNLNLNGGNMVYGGSLNLSGNLNNNSGGTITQMAGLDFSAVFNALTLGSQSYSSMSNNGTFVGDWLTYAGAGGTAVFNVSAADVFAQNRSLKLNAGSAETVVVNVSGKNILAGGGANLTNGFDVNAGVGNVGARRILWNFFEAESIDFANLAMRGSILAVNADITGGAVFDGSVAAKSYTGAREFHDFRFQPPTSVPEPALMGLFLIGLGWLSYRRRLVR
ncbi:choice-of-anchor A family protein [Marinimicrobium agarilyticum]|uniref:choice-of-anchor A family protein n=1 Tax=Marinimicrobium agarilyticum TaxID=306546 RepID=UPI0004189AF9|nr:choice-of-anchor A family protein [Marinimicrobium agarilyticum]